MGTKQLTIIAGVVIGMLLIGGTVWFFFFRSSTPAQTTTTSSSFGTATNNSTTVTTNTSTNNSQPTVSQQATQQKIFRIAQVPVVGATLIQTLHPTTTLARYIEQDNGHVFDVPLDVPGAVPRIVSNVTIPGGARAVWVESGNAAILQYLDDVTVKSVYLGFPTATTTGGAALPTRIQFLPDNITDIAASPDGKSVAYLLQTAGGSSGYVAKSDGTGSKKLFSAPLSQILISWPSQGTLLIQTKSAAGVLGIVFSVDAKSGSATALVSAQGVSAFGDLSFSHILYESNQNAQMSSYSHNIKSSTDTLLPFNLIPEKCAQNIAGTLFYCAGPSLIDSSYLDLWHQGAASLSDTISAFNPTTNTESVVASPGSGDGGVASDILEMALSPDEHYLSFTTKGDRSLWGVRLTQ